MENTLPPALQTRIETLLAEHPVILFMKGLPESPMCGFSAKAAAMLSHVGVPYHAVNILEDEELRQGLKVFGDWPTYPQLYVKGELLGGADIMGEMFQTGELAEALQTAYA
ncbi:MAG: Grx4 family monothiol glutaredoxin [Alphaproteobacteria bacterium]|jgi:monothiol glutaredoxin|nr:Grx4 family monothiol glutaredoxin [Alphaproteobacteria bacterium]